ncbi:MAG: CoA transferase, partial [Acidimicrobiales bacterium]
RLAGLERLGLDPDSVRARHPELIYAAITGYGMEGDDADRAAFDILAFWARSGIAHMLTSPGQDPPFQRGGMGDHNAGLA